MAKWVALAPATRTTVCVNAVFATAVSGFDDTSRPVLEESLQTDYMSIQLYITPYKPHTGRTPRQNFPNQRRQSQCCRVDDERWIPLKYDYISDS